MHYDSLPHLWAVISWTHRGFIWLPLPRLVRAHAYLQPVTYTLKSPDGDTPVMLLCSPPALFYDGGWLPCSLIPRVSPEQRIW